MTALYIIGGIVLLLLALLFSPVRLYFSYDDGALSASLRYLFIKIVFSPKKAAKNVEKKTKREIKKEYKKQKEEEGTKAKKKEAFSDTVKTVWSLVKDSKKAFSLIRRHLIFYNIRMKIAISSDEAAKTAVNYAKISMLISNALALLAALFVVKDPEITLRPDFAREKSSYNIAFKVKIAPGYVIAAALGLAVRFLITILENKRKRKKIKGGKKNEPATSCQ